MPVMLNPIFFIPMALSAIVPGVIGLVLINILPVALNPAIQMPWALPTFISATISAGPWMGLIVLINMAACCLLYFPFFAVADAQALEEEKAMAAEAEATAAAEQVVAQVESELITNVEEALPADMPAGEKVQIGEEVLDRVEERVEEEIRQ